MSFEKPSFEKGYMEEVRDGGLMSIISNLELRIMKLERILKLQPAEKIEQRFESQQLSEDKNAFGYLNKCINNLRQDGAGKATWDMLSEIVMAVNWSGETFRIIQQAVSEIRFVRLGDK